MAMLLGESGGRGRKETMQFLQPQVPVPTALARLTEARPASVQTPDSRKPASFPRQEVLALWALKRGIRARALRT